MSRLDPIVLRDRLRARLGGRPAPLSQRPEWTAPPSSPAPSRGRAAGDAPPDPTGSGGATPHTAARCDRCRFPITDGPLLSWEYNGEVVLELHDACMPDGVDAWEVTDRLARALGRRVDGVTATRTGWQLLEDDPA